MGTGVESTGTLIDSRTPVKNYFTGFHVRVSAAEILALRKRLEVGWKGMFNVCHGATSGYICAA
jgi:hypothetical protein